MALLQEDFEKIGEYIRKHLGQWLQEKSLTSPPVVYEIELRERMVRVEEELKTQRELMKQGFEQVDKRFEQMDRRFESITTRMDRFMIWSFALTVSATGLILGFMKYWMK